MQPSVDDVFVGEQLQMLLVVVTLKKTSDNEGLYPTFQLSVPQVELKTCTVKQLNWLDSEL